MALYKEGTHLFSIIFNATGSTTDNWFAAERVLSSPWNDLSKNNAAYNRFSIEGENENPVTCTRRFLINRKYDSCPGDEGWLAVTFLRCCPWEEKLPESTPMFSNSSTSTKWITESKSNSTLKLLGIICSLSLNDKNTQLFS